MSKKGQDNQRGIHFQNKVALLYILDNYKYSNFLKVKLEGDKFDDFTLFFSDLNNISSLFRNFEVKNWQRPLTLNDVKNIIQKERQKGIDRYSEKDSFHIIASSVSQDCLKHFNTFQKRYLFNSQFSDEKFNKIKSMYQQDGHHPILEWSKEEILFIKKNVKLVELKEKNITDLIRGRFQYEHSFFFTEQEADNIMALLLQKIIEKSTKGEELSQSLIKKIITNFCNEKTEYSESYNLTKSLGEVTQRIDKEIKEKGFEVIKKSWHIIPISVREQAIFYIIEKLKKTPFEFKKTKWFFNEILIKDLYSFFSLNLLKQYVENNTLDQEDKDYILRSVFKICKYEHQASPIYRQGFDIYKTYIFKILLKISKTNVSDDFKEDLLGFLDYTLPDWKEDSNNKTEYDNSGYQLIKNIYNFTNKGIQLIFRKYNFVRIMDDQYHSHYDYIEEFINKDFKSNFPVVLKELINQFTILYKSYGFKDYLGYEYAGGGHSGSIGQYNLHVPKWEYVLSSCIAFFYNKTKDWKFLQSLINKKCDKNYPVFIKRSFIPFLLNQLKKNDNLKPEQNKFYKALESILEIKDGLPHTEEVVTYKIYKNTGLNDIPDTYIDQIINKILYKYSSEGISYDIFLIQLLVQYISIGKTQYKEHLKRILLNKEFKNNFRYNQTLSILDKYVRNTNVKNFYYEIKKEIQDDLNMFYHSNLLYTDVKENLESSIKKLVNSSSKKKMDQLAGIINQAILKNDYQLIKVVLNIMAKNLIDFYEKSGKSDNMKCVIAQLVPYAKAKNIANNTQLAEDIIDICVQDTSLSGENQELNNAVINGEGTPSISSMRAHLCYSIESYIRDYSQEDSFDVLKLKKAFRWIKTLMDLDGSLANRIDGFPKPNYYLRLFVLIPMTTLSFYPIRKKLNQYQNGLGDVIKDFAFDLMKKTETEIKAHNTYNPKEVLDLIGRLFDIIRDLNEEEAKQVLSFMQKYKIANYSHLFIYYAIFRDNKNKNFKSDDFKYLLRNICTGDSDSYDKTGVFKREIASVIYKGIKNKTNNTDTRPDFDFFEKIKDYWVLLFNNINKEDIHIDTQLSLLLTLPFILNHSQFYYNKYREYLFKLLSMALEFRKGDISESPLHLEQVLPAISKHKPDDLIEEVLVLFLKKGDNVTGWIPFKYEVVNDLVPEIKKQQNKIDQKKIKQMREKLQQYNILF